MEEEEGKGISVPRGYLAVESGRALRKAACVCHLPFPVPGVRACSPISVPLVSQLPLLTSPPVKALVLISSSYPADFLLNGP